MNLNRQLIIVVSFVIFITLTILGLSMYLYNKNYLTRVVKEQSAARPVLKNSDLASVASYVDEIDNILLNKNLSIEERANLLNSKGFVMLASRTSNDIGSNIQATSEIFREVLILTAEDASAEKESPVYAPVREKAFFGFVYNFALNCFARRVTMSLPKKYTEGYFVNVSQMKEKEIQQQAFRVILDLLEVRFKHYAEDRALVGTRLFIAAAYLSSYKGEMPQEEYDKTLSMIEKDLGNYSKTKPLIFTDDVRSNMVSFSQYAFAYDIFNSFDQDINEKVNQDIDKNYLKVREMIEISQSADKVSLAIVGMVNETYFLASAYRRYGSSYADSKEAADTIKSLNTNVFAFPEVADITKGFYNFGLQPSGEWFQIKHYLFTLASLNSELFATMKNIGVDVEKIKNQ